MITWIACRPVIEKYSTKNISATPFDAPSPCHWKCPPGTRWWLIFSDHSKYLMARNPNAHRMVAPSIQNCLSNSRFWA